MRAGIVASGRRATASYYATVLGQSPDGYWRMGESSGNLADSSAGAHPLTVTGSPTRAVTGLLPGDSDTAIQWTGSGQYARTTWWPYPTALGLSAIIRPQSVTGYRVLASADASLNRFHFFVRDGALGFIWWPGSGGPYEITAASTIATDTTYHVAATLSGATATIYRNGVLVGSRTDSGTLMDAGSTSGLVVGNYYQTDPNYSTLATLDEVALWTRALSGAEVSAQYAASGV